MNFKPSYLALLSLAVSLSFLGGCDKQKPPLGGQRENIINLSTTLQPDPLLKQYSVALEPAVTLKDWPQRYGAVQGLPPLALNPAPTLLWKTSLGKGVVDYQRLLAGIVIRDAVIYGMDAGGTVVALTTDKKEPKVLWQQNVLPEAAQAHLLGGG